MFVYVWQYEVPAESVVEFENAYGPDGVWGRFFSRDTGYLGTELLRDASNPRRFVTIDRWISKEDRDRFRREFAAEYDAIDDACSHLTSSEAHLGDFEV
jgi:heme-degrading monooxygenase HmoA